MGKENKNNGSKFFGNNNNVVHTIYDDDEYPDPEKQKVEELYGRDESEKDDRFLCLSEEKISLLVEKEKLLDIAKGIEVTLTESDFLSSDASSLVEIPVVAKVEIPEVAKVEIPEVAKVEIPEVAKVEIPEVAKIDELKGQTKEKSCSKEKPSCGNDQAFSDCPGRKSRVKAFYFLLANRDDLEGSERSLLITMLSETHNSSIKNDVLKKFTDELLAKIKLQDQSVKKENTGEPKKELGMDELVSAMVSSKTVDALEDNAKKLKDAYSEAFKNGLVKRFFENFMLFLRGLINKLGLHEDRQLDIGDVIEEVKSLTRACR